MPALATRFVQIRADTSKFPDDVRKGTTGGRMSQIGARAGSDWAKGFLRTAKATLERGDVKVKVTPDFDGFKNLPRQKPLKVPIEPDTEPLKRAPTTRVPKVPVELDPLVGAFQAETRKQLAALAKQVSVKVPVNPDTAALREDLADKIRVVERQLKVKVPAGPEARTFETDLRALIREVEHQVKLSLPVETDGAAEAGRRAARTAEVAAGKVKLKVDTDKNNFESLFGGATGILGKVSGLAGGFLGSLGQAAAKGTTLAVDLLTTAFTSLGKSGATAAAGVAQVAGSAGSIAGAVVGAAVVVGGFALVLSSLPAIAMAATGAIFVLGGALASLPAIGVGLGAIVGALGLGFKGLSDHFKQTAKSGGDAAKSMSGVRNATRAVTQAQRELLKATKDIDRARADEIERIDDLGRALRGSVLDEADAAAAVAEARAALAEARASGDPNAVGAAERALARANLTLDEARDRTGDLAAEKEKADRDGVEGSDQVQAALERQRDATERLAVAQESLAEAQQSAGASAASAAQQLTKLAPAAQEVVDKIKALKPVFEDIRLAVQQELFEGVAGELQRLADAWKKPLKDTLTSYASTINGLFKNLGESVRNPEFIANITSAAETFRQNFDKVGKAITGPLVDAFGRLAKAAEPFINVLGDKLAGLVEHFSAWIKKADESGKLDKFMSDAAYYLDQIWQIGGNVVGIIGDLFGIVADDKTQGGSKDFLTGLNDKLVLLREWLQDPKNQEMLKELVRNFGEFVKKGVEITTWITEKALPFLTDLMTKVDEVKDAAGRFKDRWQALKDVITAPLSFGGIFDGLPGAFKSALNRVINAWNSVRFTIPAVSVFGQQIFPSITVDPDYVYPLAKGGVARATPGGINAKIAEGGKDEAVAPVDVLQDYIRTAVQEGNAASGAGQGGDIIIPIYLFPGAAEMDTIVISAAERNKSAIAKIANGGNKRLGYAS